MADDLITLSPPPLDQRLKEKLRQLDQAHRDKCNQVTQLDNEIREVTREINEIPLKQRQGQRLIEKLEQELRGVEATLTRMDEQQGQLDALEKDATSKRDIRGEILSQVCTSDESSLVEDGLDVKVAELRRLKSLLSVKQSELVEAKRELVEKTNEIRDQMTDQALMDEMAKLKETLREKVAQQQALNTLRKNALDALTECQRLIDDLAERETLLRYAKENGLVLKGDTTDELILVCRTHQEKIAKKNAEADENCFIRPDGPGKVKPTTRSTSDESEDTTSDHSLTSSSAEDENDQSECKCPDCQRRLALRHHHQQVSGRRPPYPTMNRPSRPGRPNGFTSVAAFRPRGTATRRDYASENGWCHTDW